MAILSITIPDAIANRVINAIALDHGWSEENHLTKVQFAKQVVIDFMKSSVKAYERNQATEAAKITAEASVDTDINLT